MEKAEIGKSQVGWGNHGREGMGGDVERGVLKDTYA